MWGGANMAKKRILIVDDEDRYARMMKLVLEQTGLYEVDYESKPLKAAAKAREFKPDLLLLDVIMPEMDGGDLAHQFENDPDLGKIPIVFLTALVGGKETSHGPVTRAGFLFLGKLSSDEELIRCIEENIRR
jgi:CheY-like chemotaxis protein